MTLNRRTFVGISAAATLGATGAWVPENDPAISVDRVGLQSSGTAISAYAAWPAAAAPGTPSVVVIMHVWGVDATIRDVVRRLAKEGFAAIAPDLYSRFDAPSGDGQTDFTIFRPYAQRLDRAQERSDVAAAVSWLKGKFAGTKVGIVGFCMGGRIVLNEVVGDGTLLAAAAPFYGAVADVDPKAVLVPVCGSYGALDKGIPADSVRAFAAALTVPNDFRIYDGAGHAFFDDTRPSYEATAAADAWARTLAFFKKYLGGSTQ